MILNLITLICAAYTVVITTAIAGATIATKQKASVGGWAAVPICLLPFLALADAIVVAA